MTGSWRLPLISHRSVVQNSQESERENWATRTSICLHRSLICLLRSARALRCTHLSTGLQLAHPHTPELVGKWMIRCLKRPGFVPQCAGIVENEGSDRRGKNEIRQQGNQGGRSSESKRRKQRGWSIENEGEACIEGDIKNKSRKKKRKRSGK